MVAGMLIYLNELLPTRGDLRKLQEEIAQGMTDVVPDSEDVANQLMKWDGRGPLPELPFEFRLRRAIRIIPVTQETVDYALEQFDETVARIEICRGKELEQGRVLNTWEKNPAAEGTCTACDARTFYPSYGKEERPKLPGVKG